MLSGSNGCRLIGARDIVLYREKPGEQEVWADFYVRDIRVEAGWRVMTAHEQDLANIVAGNVTSHMDLMLAWVNRSMLSLHSSRASKPSPIIFC